MLDENRIIELAAGIRKDIINAAYSCNTSAHIGGALSMVDILSVLYGAVMKYKTNNPLWDGRDRFILSKGHAALGLYATLHKTGFISKEEFSTFQTNESDLTTHPVMNISMGIESSNGSLGQGLSMGVGIALSAKIKNKDFNTYVMLGDGECNEGAVWEAAMSAASFSLNNLTAIIDNNGFQNDGACQSEVINEKLFAKWQSFGWETHFIDGHDYKEIFRVLSECQSQSKPNAIIAKTIKGKGFSMMENNNDWHHNRVTKSIYEQAINELENN